LYDICSTQLKGSLHISAEAGVGGAVSPSTRVYTAQVAGSSNAGAASSFRISVEPATPTGKHKKPTGEKAVIDFLMKEFRESEVVELKKVAKKIAESLETFVADGLPKMMSIYNQ
jgi:hypothetical protein